MNARLGHHRCPLLPWSPSLFSRYRSALLPVSLTMPVFLNLPASQPWQAVPADARPPPGARFGEGNSEAHLCGHVAKAAGPQGTLNWGQRGTFSPDGHAQPAESETAG